MADQPARGKRRLELLETQPATSMGGASAVLTVTATRVAADHIAGEKDRSRICAWNAVQPATGATTGQLVQELAGETARRLVVFALIAASVFAIYLTLFVLVWREPSDEYVQISIDLVAITASLGVVAFARGDRPAHQVGIIGMSFEVLLCLCISMVQFWQPVTWTDITSQVSWVCLAIVVFPLVVPTTPRRILVASLLAAATQPVAIVLCYPVRGYPLPPAGILLSLMLPAFIVAGVAYVPALTMSSLRAAVHKARQLGSYELVEKLGAGGMGEVWRARHSMLGRPAAIKMIRPQLSGDGGSSLLSARTTARFEREAQVTAALESPHTVSLYDFGVSEDGVFYHVIELLRGMDLEKLVQKFGPMPPERVAFLLDQMCDSLDDAHRNGLVHRDVKPANIFLTHRGRRFDFIKVLDFGLVKLSTKSASMEDHLATTDGEIHGTPAYMAPEMATGDSAIDGRTDVYGLGCVAYYLLTGKLVFDEPSAMKMIIAHSTRTPEPPSRKSPFAIPEAMDRIVMACLEKDPKKRPASALHLAEMLAEANLAAPWTPALARGWWAKNLPELAKRETVASALPSRQNLSRKIAAGL